MGIFSINRWVGMLGVVLISTQGFAKPSPTDLDWLRKQCGDGALAYQSEGKLYLTELSTGETKLVAKGEQPEFSPDSSRLAWIDGTTARGRLRKGDTTIHTIAENIDRQGGVHWLDNDTVMVMRKKSKRRGIWFRVSLSGAMQEEPALSEISRPGRECDVKLGKDGVWSYVAHRSWFTSEGKQGEIGGGCSCSFSPDGRSITALQGGHKVCKLRAIRKGGVSGTLNWKYDKGFDNHRWSSNDPRFIVCCDESVPIMVIMKVGETYCTRMGEKGSNRREMYGDFTVGDGKGPPWPKRNAAVARMEPKPIKKPAPPPPPKRIAEPVTLGPTWPGSTSGLVFVWETANKINEVRDPVNGEPLPCQGRLHGRALYGRYHHLLLNDGSFRVDGFNQRLLDACRSSGELGLEAVIRTHDLNQKGPARIVTFSSGASSRNFTLGQDKDKLVFRLRTSRTGRYHAFDLGRIEADKIYHVVVS